MNPKESRDVDLDELMVVRMAKEIRKGDVLVQGSFTPLGMVVCMLAKIKIGSDLLFCCGAANVDTEAFYPISLLASDVMARKRSLSFRSLSEYYSSYRMRPIVEFMAPAQIDRFGNLNNSVIGEYQNPKVRLPGGAGIGDNAESVRNRLILYNCRHSVKSFPWKVDFITGAGFLKGGASRWEQGIRSKGPVRIITNLAVLGFDAETKQMKAETLHPGVTIDELKDSTGFDLSVKEEIEETELPTWEDIRLIREIIDPYSIRKLEFLAGKERLEFLSELIKMEEKAILGEE